MWSETAQSEATSVDESKGVNRDFETPQDCWKAITPQIPASWRVSQWDERPRRFVDGKDVGDTVAWLSGPEGHPVPIRFSQIGSVVLEIEDGERFRRFDKVKPVVSLVADAFPHEEWEEFVADLNTHDLEVLSAEKPNGELSFDFETMRRAAQNRSATEMGRYETDAILQAPQIPTILDGRLERCLRGFDAATDPIVGVVKTHRQIYLHPAGLHLVYTLNPGQRTPVFLLCERQVQHGEHAGDWQGENLPVASWYLRLCGNEGGLPSWGYVRVEVAWAWFQKRNGNTDRLTSEGREWVDQISQTIFEYRCRDKGYGRAAVSLDPIVRAEETLGALFQPSSVLVSRFYRLTGL